MYNELIKYAASVFVDAASVRPEPAVITDILKKLSDDRFIPAPVLEDVGSNRVQRIGFLAPEEGWQMILGTVRFAFQLGPMSPNLSEIPDFVEFCREASMKLTAALEFFGTTLIAILAKGVTQAFNFSSLINPARLGSELFSLVHLKTNWLFS